MRSMRERVAGIDDLVFTYARRVDDHPGVDPVGYLGDLLCDLRHWAAREGAAFAAAWSLATTNFTAELRGDDEDEPRNLQEAHPELYARLIKGEELDAAQWAMINNFLTADDPEPALIQVTPEVLQDDPPLGVIDNIYRAARVEDLVAEYAERTGLQHDDPYTQLSDMLCDLRHWAVAQGVTIASHWSPAMSQEEPFQHGARMWIEETLGEDVCLTEDLERQLPDLVRRVLLTLDLAPGDVMREADLTPDEFRQLNLVAYWELNLDAPHHVVPPIEVTSIEQELFG